MNATATAEPTRLAEDPEAELDPQLQLRDVVTGAYGYVGRYIAQELLYQGHRPVATITRRVPPSPDPLGGKVQILPLNFGSQEILARQLANCHTLYNTYWVRFERGMTTFNKAVSETLSLLNAAQAAGVGRIVHISAANAATDSPYPYFRGKAQVEQFIRELKTPAVILRPALAYGTGDLLLNNLAWFLRKGRFFPIPGKGDYRLSPIYVSDLAQLAVQQGEADTPGITASHAVGPDTVAYRELVEKLAAALGRKPKLISLPPGMNVRLAKLAGTRRKDVVLTPDEIGALTQEYLYVDAPPTGTVTLESWLAENAANLGLQYNSELERHYRPH